MGLTGRSSQLNPTILCERRCWQELKKKCRLKTSVPFNNRLLGKLPLSASSFEAPHFPSKPWRHRHISRAEPRVAASIEVHSHKGVHNHLDGHTTRNPSDAAPTGPDDVHNEPDEHDVYMDRNPSDAATAVIDDVALSEGSVSYASNSPSLPSDGQLECKARNPSNAATYLDAGVPHTHAASAPTVPSELPSGAALNDAEGHDTRCMGAQQDATTSIDLSNASETEGKDKIRRFSLNEPGLLKTLQGAKPLSPPEQEKLDLLMKFKLRSDSVKGLLVIRAMRTEQLRDLEDLLTDSYSELMWGPLTYRPALAWILSTYLRERQVYLPHAVTLVGLYSPSEETKDPDVPSHKWWLAGAVEISFNASGKPKDIQTPVPPKDAPFLSNMAVLKKFRRRGIGQELLRAAELLAVQMGGNEMYLHCRMIDEAPLNMYKKSGYVVVETDNILSLLFFQRRRHLMYKTLAAPLHEVTMVQSD